MGDPLGFRYATSEADKLFGFNPLDRIDTHIRVFGIDAPKSSQLSRAMTACCNNAEPMARTNSTPFGWTAGRSFTCLSVSTFCSINLPSWLANASFQQDHGSLAPASFLS
jgi:hypothetical protein